MLIHCKKVIGVTGAHANPQEVSFRLSTGKTWGVESLSAYTSFGENAEGGIVSNRSAVQDPNRDRAGDPGHDLGKGKLILEDSSGFI